MTWPYGRSWTALGRAGCWVSVPSGAPAAGGARHTPPTGGAGPPAAPPRGGPPVLGDIAVAWETTRREADQEGKTLEAHLAHLLVHGVLHLLGHDHATDPQAEAMEGLERRILERLGIADPYAGSDPVRLALR